MFLGERAAAIHGLHDLAEPRPPFASNDDMAERATELLIARHRSGDIASPPRSERLPYAVIERQSA